MQEEEGGWTGDWREFGEVGVESITCGGRLGIWRELGVDGGWTSMEGGYLMLLPPEEEEELEL